MISAIVTVALLLAASSGGYRLIEDSDKHSFTDLKPIHLDIDGDGKMDTIQPRTSMRKGWVTNGMAKRRRGTEHWIAFDLILASSPTRQTFFEYRYGDEWADYWVWAMIPAGDMDGNGQIDLVFYSGDDTSDETVILLRNGSTFRRCGTGIILGDYRLDSNYNVTTEESYDVRAKTNIPARIVARWNGTKGWFEGTDLYWIHRAQLALRKEPRKSAKLIQWLSREAAVISLTLQGKPVMQDGWIKVETSAGTGWVQRNGLVTNSRFVTP